MVSFSCEGCGDVLTKKKLDPHRGQCRGASFTCIDCMVHFNGTEYRSHTKNRTKKKNQNNTPNKNGNPNARSQQPKVEDAPDVDLVEPKLTDTLAPPPAPTPPPVSQAKPTSEAMTKPVNVFDYLVTDETPNASKVSLAAPKEQMAMVDHAPSVFEPSKALAHLDTKSDDEGNYDIAYEENGFSYGAEPIPPSLYPNQLPNISTEFVTPAPKKKKDRRKEDKRASVSASEKKRKRGQEDHLSTPANHDIDTPMVDAPSSVINNAGTPLLNHSGLTGGLNRMMRSPSQDFDGSPEVGRQILQDASSPIKRSRRNGKETNGKESNGNGDPGLGISIKNRAERLVSSMFGGTGSVVSGSSGGGTENSRALVRPRRGSDSSADMQLEVRKKKSGRARNASDQYAEVRKSKRKSSNPNDGDRPSRRQKQSDERRRSDSRSPRRDSRQVTVYKRSQPPARREEDPLMREMAEHFLSLVSRDSERGCSIHKALKRFHRDFDNGYEADRERQGDDEKDLWRSLRLRRNDRGEIVVFV
ncbi:hypothetical protein N7468_002255 [Penicillium chermesinum]|uniref:Zinc finger C2H2 LYAR-type domain-containing protein n=1 Tax=Penicillium chermesinum TaxID=63820 RepID=A0A9W9PL27_9EURO|nr:uncharacterized protein N7468_002255 [Penicillium chermesinum]KAJ5247272.1 hypothetical protein N7468_002255 [Penicillium chermesinum]